MPRITIRAASADGEARRWTLNERIVSENLESDHYVARLFERLVWATSDAEELESQSGDLDTGHGEIARPARSPSTRPTRRASRCKRTSARGRASTLALITSLIAVALVPATSAIARSHSGHLRRHHGDGPRARAGDPALALQWYDITNQTIAAAAYPEPVTQSRAWAVSWLAAARAVGHAHDQSYRVAAFAQALHDTLAAQVAGQQAQLDGDLASTLGAIPAGPAKDAGIAAGKQQASSVLAERQGDGLDTASVDTPFATAAPGPGAWQPTPPAFQPAIRAGEGNAKPFLLAAADQFDPGPPPALNSSRYRRALAEVRAVGSATSTARTSQQTDVALFWEPAINIQYVQVLRSVLAGSPEPLAAQTRLVAAFNVATTDAQIAIYNAKFKYVFWRPVTAIRTGSVAPDPSCTPLFTTPRYPDWLSGHGGVAGAPQQVLTTFLGPFAPAPISVTSPTDPGSTRTYRSWSQIAHEVIDARVWEGIHFRFSDVVGARVGGEVARYDLRRLRTIGL